MTLSGRQALGSPAAFLVSVARQGLVNAPGSARAGTSWLGVLGRLVLGFPPLVLRLLAPGLLRAYHLQRARVAARLEDFADRWVCVDREGRRERRRVLRARELALGEQLVRLRQLNGLVAAVARNATEAWASYPGLAGKYEHLRPTPFAGAVVAAAPEEGPFPVLGLWRRILRRIDPEVHRTEEKIRRLDAALSANQALIESLAQQLTARQQALRALEAQVRLCRLREVRSACRQRCRRRSPSSGGSAGLRSPARPSASAAAHETGREFRSVFDCVSAQTRNAPRVRAVQAASSPSPVAPGSSAVAAGTQSAAATAAQPHLLRPGSFRGPWSLAPVPRPAYVASPRPTPFTAEGAENVVEDDLVLDRDKLEERLVSSALSSVEQSAA